MNNIIIMNYIYQCSNNSYRPIKNNNLLHKNYETFSEYIYYFLQKKIKDKININRKLEDDKDNIKKYN